MFKVYIIFSSVLSTSCMKYIYMTDKQAKQAASIDNVPNYLILRLYYIWIAPSDENMKNILEVNILNLIY